MLTFLLVVQAIVGAVLVGVILMQQSEGGGLGMGGSPTGLMSARGAADFLTRATAILAAVFIGLSILHAVLATRTGGSGDIDTSLARKPAPVTAPAPAVPMANTPVPGTPAPGTVPTPAPLPSVAPASVQQRTTTERSDRPTADRRQSEERPRPAPRREAPAETAPAAPAPAAPAATTVPGNAN